MPRTTFAKHPWSIGGGGAGELQEQIEAASTARLGELATVIGRVAHTGSDEAYVAPLSSLRRFGVPRQNVAIFVEGDRIRDWGLDDPTFVLFPYDTALRPLEENSIQSVFQWLWPFRDQLWNRREPNGTHREIGKTWFEFSRFHPERFVGRCLGMAFVATHNHFVLDRGGKVFKQSAPIIKLPADATEDDHIALLGLLNSSTACFWMKQVFYPKATAVGDISTEKGKPEANRYEFAGTGLLSFPVPCDRHGNTGRVQEIAREIDKLSSKARSLMPMAVLADWHPDTAGSNLSDSLATAEREHKRIKRRMIALQEELDWEVYRAYSLTEEGACEEILSDQLLGIDVQDRPFLWEEDQSPTGVPDSWKSIYENRRRLLRSDHSLKLIETHVYKRPWWGRQGVYGQAPRTYREWIVDACRNWLLDRLEGPRYWPDPRPHEPKLQSVAQLADKASGDHDFLQVAALYRGRPDFDVSALVNELVEDESVPFLPVLRYKPSGLRKREVWERTWDLQRKQDAGEDVGDIPVPPKYATADYLKNDYWRLRGKLDVPKERWISYPHLQPESDPSLVVGWAGWDHLQQASALVAYYDARKREGWEAKRLTPILAGLDQLLPWIHQWHPEIDPEFGETAGQSYQSLLENDAHELGLILDDIRNWEPPVKGGKRKAKG